MADATGQRGVIVTGGAGGIGLAVVRHLQANGWRAVSFDLKTSSDAWRSETVDVRDEAAVAGAMDRLADGGELPDAMVCLAGVVEDGAIAGIAPGRAIQYPLDKWTRTLDVNLTGTFVCIRELAMRLIMKRRKGVIVTCSSPAAEGAAGQAAYAASKAGVEALTRSAAIEFARYGIRVCGFRPALTDTPMAQSYGAGHMDALLRKSLIGRFAEPDEIAGAVRFLLESPLAAGRTYRLDGGLDL